MRKEGEGDETEGGLNRREKKGGRCMKVCGEERRGGL